MTFPFPLFAKFSSLKISFYMAILLIIVVIINNSLTWLKPKRGGIYEGFTQDKPFVLKTDNNIYDDFYIEIYDKLTNVANRAQYDIDKIIDITNLSKLDTTNILDVGCGTGYLVNEFTKKGFHIKGCDKSQNMINYAINISPLLQKDAQRGTFNVSDAEDPDVFERSTFSHILCLYMTIYEIKDKLKFFRNAYYGLKPGGYLVLHLTNGGGGANGDDAFNGFIDLGKPKALDEKTIIDSGIKKLKTDFGGFEYKRDWTDIYCLKETFSDHSTHNVRQNELSLFYEPIDIIIEQCKKCGFSIYNTFPETKTVGGILYFFIKPASFKK